MKIKFLLSYLLLALLAGCRSDGHDPALNARESQVSVRLGYFPNVTHAQAMIGVARGDFAKELKPDAVLETATFNAGPSVIEAIFGGKLDMAYVGPSPTINGFIKSNGDEVRVVAGAAMNGVLIVGSKKLGITSLDQLKGKRIASPQLGNTQDISAKDFVVNHLKSSLKAKGGETEVIPIANPDIETLFQKDQLHAAWVPEPWGSRLIDKGLAVLITEEKDLWPGKQFALTNIIARREFLERHPELVKKILRVHVRLTQELQADPLKFTSELNAQMKKLTGKDLPVQVMEGALKHTTFSTDPAKGSIQQFFLKGKALGLLKGDSLDIDKLIDTRLLTETIGTMESVDTGTTASLATAADQTTGV